MDVKVISKLELTLFLMFILTYQDIGVGMESILFAIRHRGSGRSEDQVEEPAAPREVVEERQTLHRVPALPAGFVHNIIFCVYLGVKEGLLGGQSCNKC